MRRKEREITDIGEKLKIIEQCKICRLGMSDNGQPYIVPLSFGWRFEEGILTLYFHSAHEGKKIGILKNNNRACFEMDTGFALIEAERACGYSCAYASVIGTGLIEFIDSPQEKIIGLNLLMKHQTGKDIEHQYSGEALDGVTVYKMDVLEFSGKKKITPP
ncbi:MAG: pyridoxamine 5'-phosphate oxidase family protein [Treponema sp.]|jgi:nitroimidazol reductase NimA-like FMN-containing flavoprotein (pyridoxamine 5'-phosphate oxidase superfamily)|nr:pyridoxamine 5'-phosphate oxidase family protein [Treponema sp.]